MKTALYTTAGAMLLPGCSSYQSLTADFVYTPIDMEIAREFVLYAHSDLVKLSAMAEKHPHIINTTVDWGDGDFESAVGAAGHVGNTEIAEYLIKKGARLDIFVMTMLGMTDAVTSLIDKFPDLLNSIGPHGFTLLHHAKVGKEASASLFEYFESKGLEETFIKTFEKG